MYPDIFIDLAKLLKDDVREFANLLEAPEVGTNGGVSPESVGCRPKPYHCDRLTAVDTWFSDVDRFDGFRRLCDEVKVVGAPLCAPLLSVGAKYNVGIAGDDAIGVSDVIVALGARAFDESMGPCTAFFETPLDAVLKVFSAFGLVGGL